MSTIGVVAAAAGGVETLREGLIEPLIALGHEVAVTLTPTTDEWLRAIGETDRIEAVTTYPVRSRPRLPSEARPHPPADLYVAAPLTANSTAKLSLGVADNQALTALCESVAHLPLIVFPRINAAHARHPAWNDHLARLRASGILLVQGEDIWPLAEPRAAGPRDLPWAYILRLVRECTNG